MFYPFETPTKKAKLLINKNTLSPVIHITGISEPKIGDFVKNEQSEGLDIIILSYGIGLSFDTIGKARNDKARLLQAGLWVVQ